MSVLALVMAGGGGTRMRSSGVTTLKPLVEVRGVPLIERNLWALAGAGVDGIVVSYAAGGAAVEHWLAGRGAALGHALGWTVEALMEAEPLGNVGCAGRLAGRADAVLVVYADNLTLIPLSALLDHHARAGAALTLATHREPFTMPFGELTLAGSRVTDYREKPVEFHQVSSAVFVLGPMALERLANRGPAGLSDLTRELIAAGRHVEAYGHDAAWIDVNDAAARSRAEHLVTVQGNAFEAWAPRVHSTRVAWIGVHDDAVITVGPLGAPELPAEMCEDSQVPTEVLGMLRREAGLTTSSAPAPVALDDVTERGTLMRTIAFVEPLADRPPANAASRPTPVAELMRIPAIARLLRRAGVASG